MPPRQWPWRNSGGADLDHTGDLGNGLIAIARTDSRLHCAIRGSRALSPSRTHNVRGIVLAAGHDTSPPQMAGNQVLGGLSLCARLYPLTRSQGPFFVRVRLIRASRRLSRFPRCRSIAIKRLPSVGPTAPHGGLRRMEKSGPGAPRRNSRRRHDFGLNSAVFFGFLPPFRGNLAIFFREICPLGSPAFASLNRTC